ncbi:MAG: TIGR02206 family membrane protein [Acidobacteriia bacterium]|nr:TIGR02206 family membrane protein [Terriglobia bacterium]
MNLDFQLFGPAHLLILAVVPGAGAALAKACRRSSRAGRRFRFGLGSLMALNELAWYAYRLHSEGFQFPGGLPLNLCDLTLWLTIAAVFTLHPWTFEIAYFVGLSGSGMALLTPDLWAPFLSYPTLYFFLAHGTVVVALLMLAGSGLAAPRPGSVWKVFGVLNAYATAVGIFNVAFKTNYMYLCRKPAGPSLLDLLGPWPLYIVGCEVVAVIMFWLLWLPFRSRDEVATPKSTIKNARP